MSDLLTAILNTDFVQGFINVLLDIVLILLNLILLPFSWLIKALLPSLDEGMTAIASYFEIAGQYLGWVVNALLIPASVLVIMGSFFTLTVSMWFFAYGVKLVIAWKKALWS